MRKTVGGFPTAASWTSTPRELRPGIESEAIRIGSVAIGGLLALYGIARGGWLGTGALIAGSLAIRHSTSLARQPYTTRWYEARSAVTILASPRELHAQWQLLSLADTLSIVERVEQTAPDRARILLGGRRLIWDVRVEVNDPGERIVWRSVPESVVPGEGAVWFVPAPGDRGTEVHVRLRFGPPASLIGAIAAGEIGDSGVPSASVAADLRRLKQMMEAGEVATTAGQPRGAGPRHLRRVAARTLPKRLREADTEYGDSQYGDSP